MMFALVGMGPVEMMIIGAIAVILFGSKLPDVARSMGNSYREFRSGLSDFQSHTNVPDYPTNDAYSSSTATDEYDEYDDATAPKFSPPPTDSTDEGEQADDDASPLEQRVKQDMADAGENEEAD
ncbi:MAG: twin-arginine translocase TatA/TatE family subunit [Pirellulaceae bacterium]